MRKNPLERRAALQRNIRVTLGLRLLLGCMSFIIATIVLLWQQSGMNMQQIMLLQAIFAVALGIFEVPTGYFADALGRRAAMIAAAVTLVAGSGCYFLASGFNEFLIAELLLALGFSFLSGADQALLYDSLLELGREAEFGKLWGRVSFWTFGIGAAAAVIGGYAGAIHLRLPLLLEFVATLLMLALTFLLVEPKPAKAEVVRRASASDLVSVFMQSMKRGSGLRWLLLYPALIYGLTQVAVWLYAPYFELSGVKTEYFGWIFAGFNVMAALASRYAARLDQIGGERMSVVMPLTALAASYLLLANFVFLLSFVFAILQQFVRGYTSVTYSQQLNARISSERRATVLSLQSMTGRVAYAMLLLPVGFVADQGGLIVTFQVMAAATVLLGGAAVIMRRGGA